MMHSKFIIEQGGEALVLDWCVQRSASESHPPGTNETEMACEKKDHFNPCSDTLMTRYMTHRVVWLKNEQGIAASAAVPTRNGLYCAG